MSKIEAEALYIIVVQQTVRFQSGKLGLHVSCLNMISTKSQQCHRQLTDAPGHYGTASPHYISGSHSHTLTIELSHWRLASVVYSVVYS